MFLSAVSHFFHSHWHVHLPAWVMLAVGAVLHLIGAIPTLLISVVFGLIGAVTFPSAAGVASYLVTVGGAVMMIYGMYGKAKVTNFKEMEAAMKGSLTEQVNENQKQIKTFMGLSMEKEARIREQDEQIHDQAAQIRELTGQVRELMMHQSRMVEALIDKDASHISEHPIQAIKQVAQIVREQGQIALEASHNELSVLPPSETDKPKMSQEPENQP